MSYSQNGQDLAVIELFAGAKDLRFVELGAGNGFDLSNTRLLESQYDWAGMLVEANPLVFSQLQVNRPLAVNVNALLWYKEDELIEFWLRDGWKSRIIAQAGVVNPPENRKAYRERIRAKSEGKVLDLVTDTLWNVLEEYYYPKFNTREIDFMSVDLEGSEAMVLMKFPFEDHVYSPKCLCIERPTPNLTHKLQTKGEYQLWGNLGEDTIFIHKKSGLI